LRGKKLFSGQNRPGVDKYVSEGNGMYVKKFAAVGKIDGKTVDIGFDASKPAPLFFEQYQSASLTN
jgi:hypothetical protein